MLKLSISCTSARPIPTATACARISGSSASRSSGVSCLLSLTPLIRVPGRRITAAAITGPASGAMPTSSQPPRVGGLDRVRGGVRTPVFRRRNPFGRVPFIEDDGFGLGESNAILLYLARGTPLLPADPRGQAQVQQWMFFEQNQSESAIGLPRIWKKVSMEV